MIHTVGPVWRDGRHNEDELLASCFRTCFALAQQNNVGTIAFPSISTGAYRFPMDRAARIALRETRDFLKINRSVKKVLLVCFGQSALATYAKALSS